MVIEDVLARYATSAVGLALLVAMAAVRAVTSDPSYRRDLRGALGYLVLFLGTAFLRVITPWRWIRTDKALFVAGLILFAFAVIRGAAATWSHFYRVRSGVETPRILRDIVDGVLFVVALLVILQSTLSINLSAVLASSAVISLVLGLALQETLGNLFAGLSLQAERPFETGDWVRIGAHQGKVVEIGWRATRLSTGPGEGLTIPNNAVAKEAVYNLSRGTALRKVSFLAGYDAPPNLVKEAASAVLKEHPRVLRDPAPVVRTADLGPAAVAYEVVFWVARWEEGSEVEEDVRSQLWYRLRRSGVALSPVTAEAYLAHPARAPSGEEDVDARRLLDRVDFLAPVDPARRAKLASRARVVRFGRGEIVLRQGEASPTPFYVVARGEVAVHLRGFSGHEQEASRLGPGECFGEMGALAGDPLSATVVAARDCALLAVDRDAFAELFRDEPAAAQKLADVLARRQERLVQVAAGLLPGTAPAREEPAQLLDRLKGIFKHLA